MDRRRLLLILAVFVAVIGTALVFIYVRGADSRAQKGVANVQALEATADIASGETYDAALAAGKISLQPVPQNMLDKSTGYQTSVDALKGKIAAVPIFAGQVIVTNQFGESVKATSGTLAIPKGMIAISVNLTDPDRVAGNIQNGQQVAIFVTGDLVKSASTTTTTPTADIQATRLLLPKVTVLNVGSPQPPTTTTSKDSNGTETTEQLPRTLLTIAVTQKDAQKVIVASKALDLTFGLLTADSNIKPGPGTSTLINSLFHK